MRKLDLGFAGLFKARWLSSDSEQMLQKMLLCKDADTLEKEYAELYKELLEDMDQGDIEHDPDYQLISDGIQHYMCYTDRRPAKEALNDYLEERCTMYATAEDSERQRCFPAEYKKELPIKGGWIMVNQSVPVSNAPIPYSVYFAKPDPVYQEVTLKVKGSNKLFRVPYYRVKIATEQGDLWLWPHEYIIITDTKALLEEVGNSFEMIKLGGDTNYDAAKVHYLGTRGLDSASVYQLLLGSLNTTGHAYFRIRPEAAPFWEFYISALSKGISPELSLQLWEHKQSGKPLFNIKIVNEHGNTIKKGERGKNTNPKTTSSKSKTGKGNSNSRKERKR